MAKDQTEASVTTAVAPAPTETAQALSLDEFCRRLSVKDRRVELIGGFFTVETQKGRVHDTAENFAARYAAFLNQPA